MQPACLNWILFQLHRIVRRHVYQNPKYYESSKWIHLMTCKEYNLDEQYNIVNPYVEPIFSRVKK